METLKNKKILITAGSTWVPIDTVRVITNIFSGRLGLAIAETANKMGADITLLMGPGRLTLPAQTPENFKIIRFRYFNELLELVKQEVSSKKYDIVIQSAAVSDYAPVLSKEKKIKSGKKKLVLTLKPTIKIVDLIKKIDPSVFLVKFKLEVGLSKKELLDVAYKSMLDSQADLIVANEFSEVVGSEHAAYILDNKKNIIECNGKEEIAQKLLHTIETLL